MLKTKIKSDKKQKWKNRKFSIQKDQTSQKIWNKKIKKSTNGLTQSSEITKILKKV